MYVSLCMYACHVFAYSPISSKARRHNGQIDSLAKLSECAVPEEDALITSDAQCRYFAIFSHMMCTKISRCKLLVIYGDVAYP